MATGTGGGGNSTISGAASITSVKEGVVMQSEAAGQTINFAGGANVTVAGGSAFNGVLTSTSNLGTLTFNSLSVQTSGGTGLNLSSGGTINVTNGTGTINNTTQTAPAIVANGVALNANFTSINSSGGTNGVSLTNVTGTSSFGTGALSGASGDEFLVSGQNGTFTYNGTIASGSAHSVNVTGKTGGTVTFGGAVTDTDTGITLTTNTNATINFTGGISASTGSNPAFTATGPGPLSTSGGTVNVTGAGNTLTTTTATALNVANTTIGASGLTFRSISSNGAAKGIILNNTGATAGLTVSGNGGLCDASHISGADCTGGTIQGGATRGVEITNAATVTLKNMFFLNTAQTSAGAAACKTAFAVGTTGCSAAIYLNGVSDGNAGTKDVTLDTIFINGTKQMGIAGTGINGMTLTNTEVENTTNAVNEAAVTLLNNTGTFDITSINLHNNDTGAGTGVLFVENGSGTMTLNVTGSTFNKGTVNSGGINAASYLTANLTVNIQSCTFGDAVAGNGLFSNGVTSAGNGTGTYSCTINNSSFRNTNGVSVSGNNDSSGTATINITNNNPIQNKVNGSNGITFGKSGATGTVTSTITGNTITKADCGNCAGMRFNGFGTGTSNATITGNTISTVNEGVLVAIGQGSTSNNVVIQSNTISGPVGSLSGFAIDATNGTSTNDNPCTLLTIGGAGALANNISGVWYSQAQGAPTAAGWSMNFDNEKGTLKMPGYAGGNTVPAYMSGRNPSVTAVQILDQSVIPIVGGVNNCPAPNLPDPGGSPVENIDGGSDAKGTNPLSTTAASISFDGDRLTLGSADIALAHADADSEQLTVNGEQLGSDAQGEVIAIPRLRRRRQRT